MAGRAGRRIYRTKRWQAVRRAVFERDGWRCVKCGRMGLIECDHRQPIVRAGDWFDMSQPTDPLPGMSYPPSPHKKAGKTRLVSPARAALMEMAINGIA